MNDIKIIKTDDGSLGLYNKKLDEIYHSRFGAYTESFEKFIEPALILKDRPLEILDICYGVGYNTKMALQNFNNIKRIDCVEINPKLVELSAAFEFSDEINTIIKENLARPDLIHFYIEDIRKFILKCNKKYDIIFQDGFSPTKQSEVWSEELISEISKHIKYDGLYLTYNHSKPVLNALLKQGLFLGKTIKKDRVIATCASFNKNLIINPLDNFELGALKTKSAITYKDKNLNLAHEEIVLNRKKEMETSTLMTLSRYLKLAQTSGT